MDPGSGRSSSVCQALTCLTLILVAPIEKEALLLYITATNQVVSVVLVVESDAPSDRGKGKRPENTLLGQPSKRKTSGGDGSKDPQPGEPASATDGVVEEISLGAIPLKAEYPEPAEPAMARRPARCSTWSTSSAKSCAMPGSGTQ